ncbi:hypothetical protein OSC27_05515 [Microbacterium sp. STN6]|uniref:hypothetical protein n=1 Tax=Microbacterium sp. STN6 TaxID=2995588 RepID=UPI002260D48A|nr:hypothetical protein [Microbacterium sp. STN6]MCX7521736.1 hypothetical protein [Microbacterium sp. STN6]
MDRGETVIVHHGGRDYVTTEEMAGIFLRQARRALETGQPELVVLRHIGGIELLLITDETAFNVRNRQMTAAVGDLQKAS